MIRSAIPYFILNGAAGRALAFYGEALGAKTRSVQRFGDVDKSCPEARRDFIMHAELQVGEAVLMMSDGPGEAPPLKEGPVSVALDFDDPDQMRRCFDALARTGKVFQPIIDAPWGSLFGVVTDEFGISWMMNGAKGKKA